MSDSREIRIEACSDEQLSELLSLADYGGGGPYSIPALAADSEAVRELLGAVSDPEAGPADALLDELIRPGTSLGRVEEIKKIAKRMHAAASDPPARHALAILYHSSVAAAFVQHSVVISSRPIQLRLGVYEDLASLCSGRLGELFRAAVERVRI